MTTDSCAACAPSPTAPIPSSVGTPRAAVKLPSEPPPVAASSRVEAEFSRYGARFFEQGNRSGFALHRRTIDAAGDGELAVRIGDLEAAKEVFDIGCVAGFGDADVDLGVGLRSDDVGPRSAGDHTTIYRQFSR